LQSAKVDWQVAVEASGWEVMLKFVQLGLGAAVVNSICTIPKGLVAIPVAGLPEIHYHAIHLKGSAKSGAAAALKKLITS